MYKKPWDFLLWADIINSIFLVFFWLRMYFLLRLNILQYWKIIRLDSCRLLCFITGTPNPLWWLLTCQEPNTQYLWEMLGKSAEVSNGVWFLFSISSQSINNPPFSCYAHVHIELKKQQHKGIWKHQICCFLNICQERSDFKQRMAFPKEICSWML